MAAIARTLAAALALAVAIVGAAHAQPVPPYYPFLPPQVVIGNPNATAGPSQAIAIQQLFSMTATSARANCGDVDWTYTTPSPNNYVLIPFGVTAYNLNSGYAPNPGGCGAPSYSASNPPANTFFKPPVGARTVCFGAEVDVISGASLGSSHQGVLKIVKNFVVNSQGVFQSGPGVVEGLMYAFYGRTDIAGAVLSGCDSPSPGDYYGLFVDIDGPSGSTGGDSITVSGQHLHTLWSMTVVN